MLSLNFCISTAIHLTIFLSVNSEEDKNAKPDGSKLAFGEGNPPSQHVAIVAGRGSLTPKAFFSHYVKEQQAVLLKGVILDLKAHQLWTDDYFRKLTNVPEGHTVLIESRKKENRTKPPTQMPLKEFVEIYNLTDQYMVEPVPVFLR